MKRRYMILAFVAAAFLAVPMLLMADSYKRVMTVAEVLLAEDDSKVVMEGYIVEHLVGEMYRFKDDTGEINLEIDDDCWKKRPMDPEWKVRVYGEIDKDDDELPKVEVAKIKDAKVEIDEETEEEYEEIVD